MTDPDTISLDKSKQKKVGRATDRIKKELKTGKIEIQEQIRERKRKADEHRGLIYIAHLPHGFYEDEVKEYFKQFGAVTNSKICRSRQTGQSKGYGYVEFKHVEVAKIAAETMNNYIMFKKRVVAEFVPSEKRPKGLFQGKQSMPGKFSKLRKRNRNNNSRNRKITDSEFLQQSKNIKTRLQSKLERLHKFGIDYDLKPVDVPEQLQ